MSKLKLCPICQGQKSGGTCRFCNGNGVLEISAASGFCKYASPLTADEIIVIRKAIIKNFIYELYAAVNQTPPSDAKIAQITEKTYTFLESANK